MTNSYPHMLAKENTVKKTPTGWLEPFLVFFSSYFIYLLTVYPIVGTEDSGELIVAAAKLDIAHPPGYPLHTLLGHLFTWLIPFGNIGWRVNLESAFFAAAAVSVVYLILKRLTKNNLISMGIALFFAFSDIFWSQAIRTETYSLHAFSLALITYLLILWDQTQKNRYLLIAGFVTGISIGNQHQIFLAGIPILIFILARNWKVILNPKIIAGGLLFFGLGLSIYAYLPIRTSLGPYNNPAFIKHEPLNTWDTFEKFVNRNIYGGTINLNSSETDKSAQSTEIPVISTIKRFIDNNILPIIKANVEGLFLMLEIISRQLLYIPLIFFIPGIYFLIKKHPKSSILIISLFIFYTVIQLKFIPVNTNLHPFTAFSNRPFYISSILFLTIISGVGIHFLWDSFKSNTIKKYLALVVIILPFLTLAFNFTSENESHNYVAYDFNRNLLESLPPNAYLISTGKDNLTFPLYYLREIDHVRPDVDLEIYYGRECINGDYLMNKLIEKNRPLIFIDLLPCKYLNLLLTPHNFVYAFGDTSSLGPSKIENFTNIRGIRKNMDFFNDKLKGLYYLKLAVANFQETAKVEEYFNKVLQEIPDNEQFANFIRDFREGKDATGMF